MGLSDAEALKSATALLEQKVKPDAVFSGLHPRSVGKLVERAIYHQGLHRLVLEVALEPSAYHVRVSVVATNDPQKPAGGTG